jgi:hypothetical protein
MLAAAATSMERGASRPSGAEAPLCDLGSKLSQHMRAVLRAAASRRPCSGASRGAGPLGHGSAAAGPQAGRGGCSLASARRRPREPGAYRAALPCHWARPGGRYSAPAISTKAGNWQWGEAAARGSTAPGRGAECPCHSGAPSRRDSEAGGRGGQAQPIFHVAAATAAVRRRPSFIRLGSLSS